MTACNKCDVLVTAPAKTQPHEDLRMEASIETLSGTREQFACTTCQMRLTRFIARQLSPPPSDVWRWTYV
jgi:ferredoxin